MIEKSKLKIMIILCTRPEISCLACVMQEVDKYVNQVIVHTGQNYDYEPNEIFFKELEIRKSDAALQFSFVETPTAVLPAL